MTSTADTRVTPLVLALAAGILFSAYRSNLTLSADEVGGLVMPPGMIMNRETLTVYRKGDDADAVYTYAKGTESEAVGEGVPALWYRWTLEP